MPRLTHYRLFSRRKPKKEIDQSINHEFLEWRKLSIKNADRSTIQTTCRHKRSRVCYIGEFLTLTCFHVRVCQSFNEKVAYLLRSVECQDQ